MDLSMAARIRLPERLRDYLKILTHKYIGWLLG